MTPVEFFEKGMRGSEIIVSNGRPMKIRIEYISRLAECAVGKQVGTRRKIHLVLCRNLLKCGPCYFKSVELLL